MSIDRRIVSILHYNGISDVNKVEKFIGTNSENYYEIIIDGKIEKLKIPGVNYITLDEFLDIVEEKAKKKKKKEIVENLEPLNNMEKIAQKIEDETNELFTTKIEIKTEEIIENLSFEEEIEKTEIENQKVLKSIEEKKAPKKPKSRTPKLSEKKIEIIESKNTDDDINDFLTTI